MKQAFTAFCLTVAAAGFALSSCSKGSRRAGEVALPPTDPPGEFRIEVPPGFKLCVMDDDFLWYAYAAHCPPQDGEEMIYRNTDGSWSRPAQITSLNRRRRETIAPDGRGVPRDVSPNAGLGPTPLAVETRAWTADGHEAATDATAGAVPSASRPCVPDEYVECEGHPAGIHWWAGACPPDGRRGFVIISDPVVLYGDLDRDGDLDVDDINLGMTWLTAADLRLDLWPCGGNGVVDSDDLLALLRAFEGESGC